MNRENIEKKNSRKKQNLQCKRLLIKGHAFLENM